MSQDQGLLQQLATAQDQIRKLSEQLAIERTTVQRLEDQVVQQQKDLTRLEVQNHHLQWVLETSPAITYRCQAFPPYTCTYIGQNVEAVLGYTPAELTADPDFCVQLIHPDDLAQVFSQMSGLLEKGKLQCDYRMRHRDSHYVWIHDDRVLLRDTKGVPQEIVGYFTDISAHKAAEALIQQQTEREMLLQDITQRIHQILDLNTIIHTIIDQVRQFFQVDRATVHRFLPDWSVDFVAESVAEPWIQLWDSDICRMLANTYLQERQINQFQNQEILVVSNIYQTDLKASYIELLEQCQVKAFAVVPIVVGEALWGLLTVYQKGDFRPWLEWETNLLQQIGSQLGMGIYQASLHEQVQTELHQRQQAEAVLRQQLGAIESAVDGIAILQNDCYIYLNSAHAQLFGYANAEDLIGQSWTIFYSPEMLAQFEQTVFPDLEQQKYWKGEVVAIRKDGTTFPEFLSLTQLKDNILVCVCRDISEQKQVELELKEQKKLLESAIQTNPDLLVYLFDVPSQSLLFVSESVANLLAYTAAEILTMGADLVSTLVHPDDHLGFAAYINQLDQSPPGTSLTFEYRVRHRDGRWLYLLLRGQAYTRDEQGHIQQFLGSVVDITSGKRTEANLQASEARFETIANLVPDFLWESEPNGFNTWCNQRWLNYTGQTLEQALGRGWLEAIHPDDRAKSVLVQRESAETGEPRREERRIRRHDGEYRWFVSHIAPVKNGEGAVIKLYGAVTDIHDERMALEASQTAAAIDAFRVRLSDVLRSLTNPIHIQAEACHLLGEQLDVDRVFYIAFDEAAGISQVYREYLQGDSPSLIGEYSITNYGWSLPYLRRGDTIVLANTQATSTISKAEQAGLEGAQLIGVIVIPLIKHSALVGALVASTKAPHEWTAAEVDLVRETAERLWTTMQRAEAEAAVKDLSERLALALQAGSIGTWDWDCANEVNWDDQMYALYGQQNFRERAVYPTWRDSLHPDDRGRVEALLQAALRGEADYNTEFRILRPNGELRWIQAIAQVHTDHHGNPNRMVGINQDITERKNAEAALIQQTNRLTLALQAGAFGVGEWDFVNPPDWDEQVYKIYGLQDLGRSVTYQDWRDLLHPDDASQVEATLSQAPEAQGVLTAEFRIVRPDGQLRWVQASAQTERDPEGNPLRMISITQDVTERKQAEADLKAQTSRLSLALQAGAFGIWEWDLGENRVWDDRVYEIYGLQHLGRPATYQDWRDVIHPNDLERVEHQMQHSLTREAPLCVDFRICRPDGELRWLQSFAQVQQDASGQPVRMVGITRDITQQRQAEAELQLLADRLSLALMAGHIGFWLWDLDQSLFWDISLCRIYGLAEIDQVTDWQTWRDMVHSEDVDRVSTLMEAAIHGAPYQGIEFRVYRTDGELRWIQSSAYVQRDENGQPVQMIGINQDITHRKQAELALQEQTSRLTLALRAGSYGIWEWDLVGDPIWDERIYEDYGLQDLGRPITYQDWHRYIHPDDQPWVKAQLEANLRARIPFSAEFRICRPDGELRWILSIAKLYCDGQGEPLRMVGIHQDITRRKLAEQEIRNSQAKFQRLVDDIGDKFVVFSHTGTVLTYVSSGLQAVFGVPPEVVLDKPWADTIAWLPDTLALAQAENQRLLTDRVASQEFEMSFIHPDGNIRTLHVVQHPVWDDDGSLLAVEGVVEDITERKAAEAALRRTNAELERATRLKDEFLANMSHELRTPLNAILGMTEGLQEEVFGPLTERQERSLATIERSSSHLLALINDILDLSKIEAGQVELDFDTIQVGRLCCASVTFVKQQAHKKQQQIATLIPDDLPNLYGDDRRLRQVLINLLTNAVKFTPKGGQITLVASYAAIDSDSAAPWAFTHPQASPGDTLGLLSISVADTGIGISPEDAQRLFQPFVQVNTALNRQYEGTGLGLSLVKRIVNLHGGDVTLTSDVGIGSCFTVQLPIIAIPNADPCSASTTAFSANAHPVDPANAPLILLAEDNEANISTTSSYLEAKGYRVIVARNGLEAVHLATTAQPNLILMDIQMPHLDGLEAIRQIRQDPALAKRPIVAFTALAMPADRERCLDAGANHYLSKPIRLKQLSEIINTLLAHISPP